MQSIESVKQHGLFTTIVVAIIGVSSFSYPREVAGAVGTNGWIIAIIEGLIWYIIAYMTYRVIEINDYNSFYDISINNFGKIIGFLVSIFFIMYNLTIISIQMRMFVEVLKMYLLEKTPTEFILIVTILTGEYIIRSDISSLVKFNEVAFLIMSCAIIFVMVFSLNKADFTNVFPILTSKPVDYIRAFCTTMFSFAGIQILYLVCPFVKNKKIIPKTIFKGIGYVVGFYVFLVVFTLAILTKEQVKVILWPTIAMVKCINIQGALVERWDGVIMSLWVLFYFTNFVNIYYLICDITRDALKLKDIRFSLVLIAPLIYCIAIYYPNVVSVHSAFARANNIFGIIGLIVIPILFYLISMFKAKKKVTNK